MPWNAGIEHLEEYYETFGDATVPVDYISPDGYMLGRFVTYLRQIKGDPSRRGQLGEDKLRRLEELGMVWNRFDHSFELHFAEAERYYRENGHLLVPANYVAPDSGLKLGRWIHGMRSARKGNNKALLNEERAVRLESIGMRWDGVYESRWERAFAEAERYYSANKTLSTKYETVTDSGFRLGRWLYSQKLAYIGYKGRKSLAPDRIRRLEGIGMVWDGIAEKKTAGMKRDAQREYEGATV